MEHEVDEITPSALKLVLEDPDDSILLIDVREPSEYRKWHISGAVNMPLRDLVEDVPLVTTDQSLVFVSRIGRRSALGAAIMQDFGMPNVFNLKGGMLAWQAAGYPQAVE